MDEATGGQGKGRGARKSKVEGTEKGFEFAKGGSGPNNTMFTRGKDGAGVSSPSLPGTTSPGTANSGDWAKGGGNDMVGLQHASVARPGVVSTD